MLYIFIRIVVVVVVVLAAEEGIDVAPIAVCFAPSSVGMTVAVPIAISIATIPIAVTARIITISKSFDGDIGKDEMNLIAVVYGELFKC